MTKEKIDQTLIHLMDFTSLNEEDDENTIIALCKQATTALGDVAAVCIYPKFVGLAKSLLNNTNIKIATVANFPQGNESIEDCSEAIKTAIKNGADEIDAVFPYSALLQNDTAIIELYMQTIRFACGNRILKVILETGMLNNDQIRQASKIACLHGADFLKTSTGKVENGATIEAAKILLEMIKEHSSEKIVGIKISGGIRKKTDAMPYLDLIKKEMGEAWIKPEHVRFGASKLLDDILSS